MSIELITRYQEAVDEKFTAESKRALVTNQDYSWSGAKTIKVYKINTAEMNDYNRNNDLEEGKISRYGDIKPLEATTEELTMSKDRSFTFMLDQMDVDETGASLEATKALERQIREVVIPEYDEYVYKKIAENAGSSVEGTLDDTNIYSEILKASASLDDAYVPETDRVLLVTPVTYSYLKKSQEVNMSTNVGQEQRQTGVIGQVDGISIVKVPANRLPADTNFILTHPVACVAPVKLEDFITHQNPPYINGFLVEGRLVYDAFVLDNKKSAIYLHKKTA